MGILYALLGACLYSIANVLAKRGQVSYRHDDGALMTSLVNVAILGIAAVVVALKDPPVWNAAGVAVFLLAGMLTTGLGRLSSLASVRAIGASRATLYKVSSPVVTVAVAYLALGERLQPLEFAGAAAVIGGLWLLTSETQGGAPGPRSEAAAAAEGATGGGTFLGLPTGVWYGLAAAFFFGTGYAARKWGLSLMPSVIMGAFVGSVAGFSANLAVGVLRRGWKPTLELAIRNVPNWYLFSGVSTSLAMLSQFAALAWLSASVTSVLLSTEPLWTMVLGYGFLRGQENLTRRVVVSGLIIVAGAILLMAA